MTPLVPPTMMVVAVKLLDLSHLPQIMWEEVLKVMMKNKSSLLDTTHFHFSDFIDF
jgi:hypothetical protein